MTQKHTKLSAKSVTVLTMIASGHTYQQILDQHPDLTYPDIFRAAREALDATETIPSSYQQRLAHIRKTYPRAYEQWTQEEDATLVQLARSGVSVDEMARQLQRQPGAIRSRVQKLEGLMSEPQTVPELWETEANLEAEFHEAMLDIFTEAERQEARRRLKALGYSLK
jgi:transketolase